MEPESKNRDLVHVEASWTPKTETDVDIAPLIQKVGATSIAEIEKLIGELQQAKHFLQTEGGANSARDGSLYKIRSVGFSLGKNYL